MRHHIVRHALFVIALMSLLFTLDAAIGGDMALSAILAIAVLGVVFAVVLLRLAGWALQGSIRTRLAAALGINVLGLIPALIMLPVVMSLPDVAAAREGTRAVIMWLLSIVAWTTTILASVAPIRRPRSIAIRDRSHDHTTGGRRAHALSRV